MRGRILFVIISHYLVLLQNFDIMNQRRIFLLFLYLLGVFSSKAQTNNQKYESDSLLSKLMNDSLFVEYKYIEYESFDNLLSKKSDSTHSKWIHYEYERLESPEAKRLIENLRKNGIENPELYYLRNMRKITVYKMIYQKYPELKKYSSQILTELVIDQFKKDSQNQFHNN